MTGETIQQPDHFEHERKFILPDDIDIASMATEVHDIEQSYISIRGQRETRVRKQDDNYYFTVKEGQGMSRPEYEIPIDEETYGILLPLAQNRTIQKTRHVVPFEGSIFEIDEYQGELAGLRVVEVEFPDSEAAQSFVPPSWFGQEVTEDRTFKNQQLALGLSATKETDEHLGNIELGDGLLILSTYIETMERALGRPIVVAIAGGSASGKTSAVATFIQYRFHDRSHLVSLDDYYKGVGFMQQRSEELGRELNFDEPEVVDIARAARDLQALKQGSTIQKPKYDFKTGESSGEETLDPSDGSIIVVEGLFALSDTMADAADITCFVDLDKHGRLMRRLFRDVIRTSWSHKEVVDYFEVVERMYKQYVEPTKNNADVVIFNNYNPQQEAERAGQYEIQIKYKANKLSVEDLIKMGAELITGPIVQHDTFYNPESSDLSASDELIRIRRSGEGCITFGYKGPRIEDGSYRKRPKIEFTIDGDTLETIRGIYPIPSREVMKTRTLLVYEGVIIAIDDVDVGLGRSERHLGRYIELRSTDAEHINEVAKKLSLSTKTADTRAYFDM